MTYAERVIADGAAAYWPLDETSGLTAFDRVGTRHGTISGGVTLGVPGVNPSGPTAMLFDGTGGVRPATLPPQGSTFTLEAWVKPTAAAASRSAILARNIVADGDFEWERRASNTLTRFRYYSTVYTSADHTVALPLNAWAHVLVVGAVGQATHYVNGVAAAPVAMTLLGAGVGVAGIGCYGPVATEGWLGVIADVALYPRALTPAEISAHYTFDRSVAAGSGGGLIKWW